MKERGLHGGRSAGCCRVGSNEDTEGRDVGEVAVNPGDGEVDAVEWIDCNNVREPRCGPIGRRFTEC